MNGRINLRIFDEVDLKKATKSITSRPVPMDPELLRSISESKAIKPFDGSDSAISRIHRELLPTPFDIKPSPPPEPSANKGSEEVPPIDDLKPPQKRKAKKTRTRKKPSPS